MVLSRTRQQQLKLLGAKSPQEIGEDPKHILATTHGKRAADNLSRFKPNIKEHEMNDEVYKFEESISSFPTPIGFMALVRNSEIHLLPYLRLQSKNH